MSKLEKKRGINHLRFNPNQLLTTSHNPDQLEFQSTGILANTNKGKASGPYKLPLGMDNFAGSIADPA